MRNLIVALGADDSEMSAIETLLRAAGVSVVYALGKDGKRVIPSTAYSAHDVSDGAWGEVTHLVECHPAALSDGMSYAIREDVVRVDHHAPGDRGFGKPPAEFFSASSIGQIIEILAAHHLYHDYRAIDSEFYSAPGCSYFTGSGWSVDSPFGSIWVDQEHVLIAAADHCLGAAYRGECPGVDPDALMEFRVRQRASFQKRDPDQILADIAVAREALRTAPTVDLGGSAVCDFRNAFTRTVAPAVPGGPEMGAHVVFGDWNVGAFDEGDYHELIKAGVSELPDAAAREGVAYLATVIEKDGRKKVVIGGSTTPEQVRAFMESFATSQGLTGVYGDPARGFAGGYVSG